MLAVSIAEMGGVLKLYVYMFWNPTIMILECIVHKYFYRKNKRHYGTWTQVNMEDSLKTSRQELWDLSEVVKGTEFQNRPWNFIYMGKF
jgi:hypothetical protein